MIKGLQCLQQNSWLDNAADAFFITKKDHRYQFPSEYLLFNNTVEKKCWFDSVTCQVTSLI